MVRCDRLLILPGHTVWLAANSLPIHTPLLLVPWWATERTGRAIPLPDFQTPGVQLPWNGDLTY